MSEINTTLDAATEESIAQSIEELGGIPLIELDLSVSGMTAYPTDKTLSIEDMAADAKKVGDELSLIEAAVTENAEAIENIGTVLYPVGAIFMTASNSAPDFPGTWVEVAITATWTQLKTGKRDYAALESGDTGGTVHFWLRTE